MEIIISKDTVRKHVISLASIVAKNLQDMNLAPSSDNAPILDIYITESCAEAQNELYKYLKETEDITFNDTDRQIIIQVKDTIRMSATVGGLVRTDAKMYAAHYCIGRWFNQREETKNTAEAYMTSSANYLAKIFALIMHKDNREVIYEERIKKEKSMHENMDNVSAYKRRMNDNLLIRPCGPEYILADNEDNILTDKNRIVIRPRK